MAKRKRKKPKSDGGHYKQAGCSPADIHDLANVVQQICDAGDSAGPLWGQAHKLLIKTKADSTRSAKIIASRDIDDLIHLVHVMQGIEEEHSDDPIDEPSEAIDHEVLKQALKAFRKRLKLTKLDHESRLGVGPMSSGREADFDAIVAPHEFKENVWLELTRTGQLESLGRGFYKLGPNAD